IELTTKAVAATDAITDDLILDYDSDGKVVAITLDNYSKNVETVDLQALGAPLYITNHQHTAVQQRQGFGYGESYQTQPGL
ncbi:MAG: DUF2283 domain-containing protein, partial [Bacteroidota bacterium]